MFVRRTAFAGGVLALALVIVTATPARRPPSPGDKQAPTTPTNLRITASSSTSVSLAWDPSTDNTTNWWYCVQLDGSGCFRVNPPQTTFTRSFLTPGGTTSWSVYAIDAAGNRSGNSNAVTFTAPRDTTAPTAPTLTASAVYPSRVYLSWTASTDDTTFEPAYRVYIDGRVVWDSSVYRFFPALHLSPSTTYEFKVDARDNFGNVAQSNVLNITTPPKTDNVAPSAPTNLTLGFQSTSFEEAWLTWGQSTDDTDSPGEILYDVYFNGVRHDDDAVIGSNGTIAYCRTQAGVGPSEIVVRALDTSGNESEPSNVVPFDC
jgi:hypothetical protein